MLNQVPAVGLGTFLVKDQAEAEAAVLAAYDAGYRHFDCAMMYENHVGVGRALKKLLTERGVPRDSFFVTSKLAMSTPLEGVASAVQETLRDLCLEQLDLFLIHSAVPIRSLDNGPPWAEARRGAGLQDYYRALEAEVDKGTTRFIGVSNFNAQTLNDVLNYARIPPLVNQVEFHVCLQQPRLHAWMRANNVHLVAYGSLGAPGRTASKALLAEAGLPPLLENPVVTRVAAETGKTPAQVLLRFCVQAGVSVIPKSTKASRIVENFDIQEWALSEQQFEDLKALDAGCRTFRQDWHGVPSFV